MFSGTMSTVNVVLVRVRNVGVPTDLALRCDYPDCFARPNRSVQGWGGNPLTGEGCDYLAWKRYVCRHHAEMLRWMHE